MDAYQHGEKRRSKRMNEGIFKRRKRVNTIGLALSVGAMSIGMIFLLWILAVLIFKGFSSIHL